MVSEQTHRIDRFSAVSALAIASRPVRSAIVTDIRPFRNGLAELTGCHAAIEVVAPSEQSGGASWRPVRESSSSASHDADAQTPLIAAA